MSGELHAGGVDFHCHLDLYPDHEAAIARAEAAQIYTLTVTTTPKAWPRNHELTHATRFVRAALGLHPQLVAERANELSLWERHLPETRYVGEVGLDAGPRFYRSLETQRDVFRAVLEACAAAGGKILTVHSVRTAPMVLDMIERHLPAGRGAVVMHWFSGSASDARRAAAMGCYFSVNAEMTRSARGRALIGSLPIDRLLTETDGPFTNVDGRPAEPRDVEIALQAVAEILAKPVSVLSKTIRANLKTLLDLAPPHGEAAP
jgi:TatD DNase family protein